MTIYGGLHEIGAQNKVSDIRRALSRWLTSEGVVTGGDFDVTGDPSRLAVNIARGQGVVAFQQAILLDFALFDSDSVEQRTLAAAPGSGSRIDLVYCGAKDKAYGDAVNSVDFYVKTGVVNSGVAPAPDIMAGAYPIAWVTVPAGATLGSQCQVTMLTETTAPVRDGGYSGSDLVIPPPIHVQHDVIGYWFGNGITARSHGAPFTPSAIHVQITGPLFATQLPGNPVVISNTITATQFQWHCANLNGANYMNMSGQLPKGSEVTATYLCVP